MNYCPFCGEKIEESFKHCPFCGADLTAGQDSVAKTGLSGDEEGSPEEISPGGCGAALRCLAGAAFCFFMAFGPWQLRLFSVFGDAGSTVNTVVFCILGVLNIIYGMHEFIN